MTTGAGSSQPTDIVEMSSSAAPSLELLLSALATIGATINVSFSSLIGKADI